MKAIIQMAMGIAMLSVDSSVANSFGQPFFLLRDQDTRWSQENDPTLYAGYT